jgi:sigma-54 dependent transcriptional regulator, acetoin dehydrogenase operon transcriptional activator AcoR
VTVTTQGKSGAKRGPGDAFRPIASSLHLPSAHVALIDDSHDRCAALGLSRFESPDLSPISLSELAVMRERNQRLYAHAAPVMEMLFEQIEHTQSMVVLCDATGTVLHAIGDDDFLGRANKVALAPGANWSEASKGTNAVGTALISEQPTLVHADEHFVHANHFLTCSATPIFDPRGNVLGVLDCSGDQRGYHQHTMALIRMSARMIENHWLSDDYRHVMRLHFHGRVDFIGTLKEGILAVTADGRIAGANHSALELLGQSGAALRMQSLSAVLGVTVSQLVDHFRSPLATPYPVHGANGQRYLLLARFDWPVWHTIAEAAGPAAIGPAPSRSPIAGPAAAAAPRPAPPPAALPREAAKDPWAAWRTGDAVVHAVIDKLVRVVDRRLPIVLHGEVGTGKETLARALHLASNRSAGPFVSVRCAALPEASLAAELFGDGRVPGKLAQARGGTLFVSEVADLPAEIQARLLAVLQEGSFTLPGSRQVLPADFQLVVATRLEPKDLRERMTAGHVASALYYRLNGLALRLPPLRERSDVLALARTILTRETRADARADGRADAGTAVRVAATSTRSAVAAQAPAMSLRVEALLRGGAWPGNVRQLENVLRAASIMSSGQTLEIEHLPEDFVEAVAAAPPAHVAIESPVRSLEALEIEAIEAALRTCGGNISEASKRLGISRNTIYRRLRWKDQSS